MVTKRDNTWTKVTTRIGVNNKTVEEAIQKIGAAAAGLVDAKIRHYTSGGYHRHDSKTYFEVVGWRKKSDTEIRADAEKAEAAEAKKEAEAKRKAAAAEKRKQEAADRKVKETARRQAEKLREAATARKAEAAYAKDMVRILQAAGYEVTKKKGP